MEDKILAFEQALARLSEAELDSLLERVSIFSTKSVPVDEYVKYAEEYLSQCQAPEYYYYHSLNDHNDDNYNQYDYAA